MSSILPVSTILKIADVSQYLAELDIANNNAFQGASVNPRTANVIYIEKKALRNRYNLNPSDPTLIDVGNYVFALCGPYSITAQNILSQSDQPKPVITGPSNESVLVGQIATFMVSVTSTISYSTQWYLNGAIIIGATSNSYSITNAQLSDSGGIYSAIVTNGAGSTSSASAILTVTQTLIASYYYGATNYYAQITGGNYSVPFQGTTSVTNGQPIIIPWPTGAATSMNQVIQYPISQSLKTQYFIPPLDNGSLGDDNYYDAFAQGGYNWIVTRRPISLNLTNLNETFT